jgi:hypothetical protein
LQGGRGEPVHHSDALSWGLEDEHDETKDTATSPMKTNNDEDMEDAGKSIGARRRLALMMEKKDLKVHQTRWTKMKR